MKNGKWIDASTFVKVWQTSKNPHDAAKRLNQSYASVESRASTLRKRGVPLKKFPARGIPKKLDIEKLAAIAKRYAP